MLCCATVGIPFLKLFNLTNHVYIQGIYELSYFFNIYYCISSDFSDLPGMTGECIVLSVVPVAFNMMYLTYCDNRPPKCMLRGR